MASQETLLIKGTYNTLYNAITQPDRKFVVTHYFLDEWLPILGPSLGWLVVALRQRCYWNQRSDWCIVNKATLAQETAMQERTIERSFKKDYSDWFILNITHRYRYRTDLGKKVRDKNRYHLLLDEPLAPRHQVGLALLLAEMLAKAADPLDAALTGLQTLLTDPHLTDKISYSGPIDHDLPRQTILELVAQALNIELGDFAGDQRVLLLDQRCSALYNKIVQPNRIYVGWQYFRLNWLTHLGQSLAWMIIYLRRRCFWDEVRGELRDECSLFKKDLAAAIGQTPRNLANLNENPYTNLFFTQLDETKKGPVHYRVRLVDEPLTPSDVKRIGTELELRLAGQFFGQDVEDGQLNLFPLIDQASNRQNFAYGQVGEDLPVRSAKKSRSNEDLVENLSDRSQQKSRLDEKTTRQAEDLSGRSADERVPGSQLPENLSDWWSQADSEIISRDENLSDRFQQKSRLDEKTTSQAEDLSGRESKKGRLDQIDQEKMSQHEEAEIGKNVAILKDSLILLEPKKRQHPKSKDAAEFKALSKELDELAIQEPARGRLLANSELTPLEVRAWLLYAETQPGLKNPERYVISRLLAADMPPAAFVEFAQLSDETLASFKRRAEQLMQGRPLEEKISSDLLDIFSQWLEAYHKLDETLVRNLLQAAKAASTTAEEVIEPIDQEADWAEQVWSLTLDQLQLKMTKSAFNSWLRQTHPLHYDQDHLVIAVQNDYAKDWLENRLADMIERVLAAITGRPLKVEFSVERQLKANTG